MPHSRNRTREESRARYVENIAQIKKNIMSFNQAINQQDPRFLKPVVHFKKWYYLDELDLFAPEKFIGYKEMNPDRYFGNYSISNEMCDHYLSTWFETSEASELELKLRKQISEPFKINKEIMIYTLKEQYRLKEPFFLAEEIKESKKLHEGAIMKIYVNRYERNAEARRRCIDHYGLHCQVCNINFEEQYGDIGRDFIHVHHIIPLHELGTEYIVDPINDLRPVCPNCHAMLHRKDHALSINELKKVIHVI